MQSTVYKIQLK